MAVWAALRLKTSARVAARRWRSPAPAPARANRESTALRASAADELYNLDRDEALATFRAGGRRRPAGRRAPTAASRARSG